MISLTELVERVLDEVTAPLAPHDVADAVVRRVPDDLLAEALRQALGPCIERAVAARRRTNPILNNHTVVDAAGRPTASAKVAAIRDDYERALRDRVFTRVGWKYVGDLTYDDLLYAAERRRRAATSSLVVAHRLDGLAQRLREYGAQRVRDLPREVALGLFTEAAS